MPTATESDLANTHFNQITVRTATQTDNDALRALFAKVPMQAELKLSVRRDPDYFALYQMQSDAWESLVGERDRQLMGTGSILARRGYLDGAEMAVGYLGDLRIAEPSAYRALTKAYGERLSAFAARHQCPVFLTAIIASNQRAIGALTSRRSQVKGIPAYIPLRAFDIRAIYPIRIGWRRPSVFKVERAREADIASLEEFLDADGKQRPLGYSFTRGELRRRLQEWPGLSVQDFLIARDRGGSIVGCLALWNAHAIKQMVVVGYGRRMRYVRAAYNVLARMFRSKRLPPVGGVMQYSYITHLAIPSDNPLVLRALLNETMTISRDRGDHFVSMCAYEGDPLSTATRGYLTTNLPARLYLVAPPGTPPPDVTKFIGRIGFEMALV